MRVRFHFVTTNSPVSRVIRYATNSRFSHVEMVVDDSVPEDLAKGRRGYLGALGHGGVQIRDFHYDKWSDEAILETDDLPADVHRRIWEYAFSRLGKKYDWRALFGMLLGKDWRDPDGDFCSEVAISACDHGPLKILNDWGKPETITPGMFFDSPALHLVEARVGSRVIAAHPLRYY